MSTIKKVISIISSIAIALVVSMLPAPAMAVPQPPHVFHGAVTVGGAAAADGLSVTAAIAGASFPYTPSTQTSGGRYGDDLKFKVPADDTETTAKEGGEVGDTIIFYVEGVEAGTHTFAVGNVTQLDLSISALPTLAAPTNVTMTTPSNDNTPTFTWNAVTGAKSYQLRIDTNPFSDIGNVITYTFTIIDDGSHSFEVRGVDAQGTPGPSSTLYSFTIDTTPPQISITALTPDPTTDTTPTFTGTAIDATTTIASVEYRIDSGNWTAATAVDGAFDEASENYTFTTPTLSIDSHTAEVRATDAANNVIQATNYASDTFTITTAAPSRPPAGGGAPGGGGGAAGITSVLYSVTQEGRFTENVTALSADRKVMLFIPKDTIGLNRVGQLISSITIKEMEDPPDPPPYFIIIPPVYYLGPEGATFDPPIDLTISYDASLIPEGLAEKNLVVATFDRLIKEWVKLESTVYPETDTITAKISQFAPVAVLAPIRPASFTVTDLSITPAEVNVGEQVNISFLITNAGDLTGSYEVSLEINNKVVQTKEVTLDGGDSETVSFSITPEAAGEYSVNVNGLLGTFEVKELLAPAAFTTSALNIFPTEVNIGERVTISVIVTNTGDLTGAYEVTLKIDDVMVDVKEVVLARGASQEVVFTTVKHTAGTYTVDVNGLHGSFVVEEEIPPPPTPAPAPPAPAPIIPKELPTPPINWWLIGGITIGAVAAGLIYYFVIRKRIKLKGSIFRGK